MQGLITYRKIMTGLVIEQVDGWPKDNQSGAFLDYGRKCIWKHSWVDTWRSHLHYEGGFEGDKMIVYPTSTYYESDVRQEVNARQVFSKIIKTSFRWDWEMSKDGDKIWQTLNGLDYQKQAEGPKSGKDK